MACSRKKIFSLQRLRRSIFKYLKALLPIVARAVFRPTISFKNGGLHLRYLPGIQLADYNGFDEG
jgi:hypothetical protein